MSRKRSINLLSSPIPSKVPAQSSFLSSTPIREESQEGTNFKNVSHIDNDKTDWMLCFLCQKPTKEKLQCSALSKEDPKKLYDELATRIKKFHSIKMLPIPLNITKLEDGLDLGQSLHHNSGKFHKSCKLKFAPAKLEKALQKANSNPSECNIGTDGEERSADLRRQNRSAQDIKCFLCGEPETEKNPLHLVQSFRLDQRVRRCAHILNDSLLHAKLQGGDLIAKDAKYHRYCLTNLYRKASNIQLEGHFSNDERKLHGIAFGKVISFIEEALLHTTDTIPVFKLSDLIKLYDSSLKELGLVLQSRIHSTRFKQRLLAQFEDMSAYNEGREVMLAFTCDIGEVILTAASTNYDDDGYILAKAANILRRDILGKTLNEFDGKFDFGCQELAVPATVNEFVTAVLRGTSAESNENPHFKQASLTISQLLAFNTTIRTRNQSLSQYHSKQREPPLPVYLAQMIHAKTRNLGIIRNLSKLGICVSKDRFANLSISMGNAVIEMNEKEGHVLPTSLRKGLFSTASVDNIDIETKSSTSFTSLHGTAASINQHISEDFTGVPRRPMQFSNIKTLKKLPSFYTDILPAYLPPVSDFPSFGKTGSLPAIEEEIVNEEENWLKEANNIPWSVFHAKKHHSSKTVPDISAMLPIWRDNSKSPATIKHILGVLGPAIEYLNPEQPLVVGFDQPLFAIAKRLQWHHPDQYGYQKLVIMLGALHIEIAMLGCLGDWLQDSGWLVALSNAGVTSPGNESLLTGHNIAPSKYAHQVTAKVLHKLRWRAFETYKQDSLTENREENFAKWCAEMEEKSPQFQFWSITLSMQKDYLLFLRSIRSRNFDLYVYSLEKILPWMFAFDHYNYARWMSVHQFDMEMLHLTNPSVYHEFHAKGNFVVARTTNDFSSMGLDQRHEQLNKDIKGDGGMIGLTENEDKFRHWTICSPEVARAVTEFEEGTVLKQKNHGTFHHHEDSESFRTRFAKHVNDLLTEFEQLGNPFIHDESGDLIQLGTKDIMCENVIKTVKTINVAGRSQYKEFREQRLVKRQVSLDDPIKKNKFSTFKSVNTRGQSSTRKGSSELKKHIRLFSQMYISTQTRGGNMDQFFSHETLSYPPALSKNTEMRSGDKSLLIKCLEPISDNPVNAPKVTAGVLEGSVLVNMLKPKTNQTFQSYCVDTIKPAIYKYNAEYDAQRMDIVFDTYKKDSLKAQTRLKRGKGVRRKVQATSKAPSNWQAFLRIGENKTELFKFIPSQLLPLEDDSEVTFVYGFDDVSKTNKVNMDMTLLSPTNHEEADTRVFLHSKHISENGLKTVTIKTVDTDVLILSISTYNNLKNHLQELWIDFGAGKNRRFFPVHKIYEHLGEHKSLGLPFFHAFTGCDQVSFMSFVSKSTAWKIWEFFEEATPVFMNLSNQPTLEDVRNAMPIINRFTVLLYNKTSNLLTTNECRRELFCQGRDIDKIPPTGGALWKHTCRSAYIAGYDWCQSTVALKELPSPEEWGWKLQDGKYIPHWTELPEASIAIRDLVKCKCNPEKGCRGRCKCLSSELPCTELCLCKGDCERD